MVVGPSVSGDRDADEFSAQSKGDFSFFDGEGGGGSGGNAGWSGGQSGADGGHDMAKYERESKDIREELMRLRPSIGWSGKVEIVVTPLV